MAGIGTFQLSPDEAEASVTSALQCGYRLIDTANAYVNEKAVGRAIKKSGVDRKEIFLETKLWPSFYEQADAVEKTLERLDTDYIDLLLIHQPAGNYVAGYKMMEKACKLSLIHILKKPVLYKTVLLFYCKPQDSAWHKIFPNQLLTILPQFPVPGLFEAVLLISTDKARIRFPYILLSYQYNTSLHPVF